MTRHSAENGRKTNSFSRYFNDDDDDDGGSDGGDGGDQTVAVAVTAATATTTSGDVEFSLDRGLSTHCEAA